MKWNPQMVESMHSNGAIFVQIIIDSIENRTMEYELGSINCDFDVSTQSKKQK